MESSSTSSRFRFRDHSEVEDSEISGTESDVTSVSSDRDDESDLGSMTGKGIKHFCSELLELKQASNDEFRKNIFSNYTAFIRIFEEAERLGNELVQLKDHLKTQKQLVTELADITCSEVLSEETMDPHIEQLIYSDSEPPPSRELEDHINDVSETLDLLLSENRIDEALDVIELEDENFQNMQFEENCSLEELSLYGCAISERKAVITLQLTRLAENWRTATPELQKTLLGLCRLGESHLATQLMLKYYHARIETGIHDLQCSKSFSYCYIRELAKLVFSLISQAARSFVRLYGETSPYATELIRWAGMETKVYADCFNQYLKSISDVNGRLLTAAQALHVSMFFCSSLETQRLVLWPYLVKYIRPSVEEILSAHMEHIKKVIGMFTATDDWILSRYLVSGIISGRCSSMLVGEEPEYCLLTSSGRKLAMLIQVITEDVTPLVALQMEGSIFCGLINLFEEYVVILEKALIYGTVVNEKGDLRINLATSLQQQISILANLSALEQLFLRMAGGIVEINSDHTNAHAISYQQHELASFTLSMHEASSRLRVLFCQQYIHRITSMETSRKLAQKICGNAHGDPSISHDPMPSVTFQVLFLELRKLERLAEGGDFEKEWLLELLREIVEAIIVQISENKEIWATTEENSTMEHSIMYKQFVLDLLFLVEITKYGGYFSNNPSVLLDLMKPAFLTADLIPERDVNDNDRMIDSANEAIQKLLEIEKTTLVSSEESTSILGDETREEHSEFSVDDSIEDGARSLLEDPTGLEVEIAATGEPETAILAKTPSLLNADSSAQEVSSGIFVVDIANSYNTDTTGFGIIKRENIVGEADDEVIEISEKDNVPALPLSEDIVGMKFERLLV